MTKATELDPTKEKGLDLQTLRRTVQALPTDVTGIPGTTSLLYINFASVADQFIPWGRDVFGRDKQLREFWMNETMLAGAMYSIAAAHAAFSWELQGPDKLVEIARNMMHSACLGAGWEEFVVKITLDLMGQDNGAFLELIRQERRPDSPVIGINHLDANMCRRTGNPEFPVIYTDMNGRPHKLAWYDVITLEEMPSPIQTMYSVQYCAVTRVLRMAQIMRDLAVYKAEKISGRFERSIHIVSGPAKSQIEDAIARGQERADSEHLTRFIMPMILASLDPEKPVSHVEIPLASLPDGFEFDEELKWYIAGLALGFGRDYQDFAPLPGGNLGTSQQAEILHLKSRGKGPALFMALLANAFNFHGVLPRSVTLAWKEQDLSAESDRSKMSRLRAEERKTRVESGEISAEVARNIAVDIGDLDPKYLTMMTAYDATQRTLEGQALESFRNRRRRFGGEDFDQEEGQPAGPAGQPVPAQKILDDDDLNAIALQQAALDKAINNSRRHASREWQVQEAARAVEIAAGALEKAAERPQVHEITFTPKMAAPIVNVSTPEQKDQSGIILAVVQAFGEKIESTLRLLKIIVDRPVPEAKDVTVEKLADGRFRLIRGQPKR